MTRMYNEGVPKKLIAEMSNHSSVEALCLHQHTLLELEKARLCQELEKARLGMSGVGKDNFQGSINSNINYSK